jgi:hypothetical protein
VPQTSNKAKGASLPVVNLDAGDNGDWIQELQAKRRRQRMKLKIRRAAKG